MKKHFQTNGNAARLLLTAAFLFLGAGQVTGQTAGLGINPGRIEVEMQPGDEKTVAFQIESPPSTIPVAGRLLLSLTDWNIRENADVEYVDPGNAPNSASSWVVFSPVAISISSAQRHLVRVTAKVPPGTAPGVYRTAIFIQERPPASPPKAGERLIYFRFRYVFFLWVIVPPVEGHGELSDVTLVPEGKGFRLICQMENTGSRHVRPILSWSLRTPEQKEIDSVKGHEVTPVLPHSTLREPFSVSESLPPGNYEISAMADFQDGRPLQTIKRTVQVKSYEESPPRGPLPAGRKSLADGRG